MGNIVLEPTPDGIRIHAPAPILEQALKHLHKALGLPIREKRSKSNIEGATAAFIEANSQLVVVIAEFVEEWAKQRAGDSYGATFDKGRKRTILSGVPIWPE